MAFTVFVHPVLKPESSLHLITSLDSGSPTKAFEDKLRRSDGKITRPRLPTHTIQKQAGFSLIEMIVVIVVLGLGLTGVTMVITETVQQSPKPLVQTRAMELAQTYLDEILPKRFDETSGQGGVPRCDSTDNAAQACSGAMGSEAGENRSTYDDVDDYDGLDNQPPVLASGNTPPNFDDYRVQVSVTYAGGDLGLANRSAKRITVTVTTPLGNSLPVTAYRVNF